MSSGLLLGNHVVEVWSLVEVLAGALEAAGSRVKPKGNYSEAEKDQCQTPEYGTDTIVPFIPDGWVVWESAVGRGRMADRLEYHNHRCVRSDVLQGQDRFSWYPDEPFDVEVTNVPFRLKYKWIQIACEQGHPFALLVPGETIFAKKYKAIEAQYRDIEIISPDDRFDFEMPNKGEAGSAQFPVVWITRGLGIGRYRTDVPVPGKPKKGKRRD